MSDFLKTLFVIAVILVALYYHTKLMNETTRKKRCEFCEEPLSKDDTYCSECGEDVK